MFQNNTRPCSLSEQFRVHLKSKNIPSTTSFTSMFTSEPTNGENKKVFFMDIYQKYKDIHLITLSESSKVSKIKRCDNFLPPLYDIKMCLMTPALISEFIIFSKKRKFYRDSGKRNFDKQVKDLISIFNWYADHIDFQFRNPVRRHHIKLGIIDQITPKERQISANEYKRFHHALKPDFQDFATLQFYCAGRVGEIAGLQKKNIDLDRKFLRIKEVVVWIGNKPQIKSVPKNGCERAVFINATMAEILQRRMGDPNNITDFIFQINGAPLRYNQINENYNRAWKAAGLADKFSGTHQIRYAAAQMARRVSGSLEAAKSITGHQSAVMANKYSSYVDLDLNRKTVESLEESMRASSVALAV